MIAKGGLPIAVRLAQLEEIEVVVEKLVAGGDGLVRFEGIPIFVPRSAPGDRLRVRVVERHPNYARAQILDILAAGPGRRPPPCPHFARCGGCDLQHLDDEYQGQLKAEAVRETLRRLAGVEIAEPIELIRGEAWGYRLRAQLRTAPARAGAQVGYFARGSHDLVAIDCCPILVPELEALVSALPGELGDNAPRRLDLAAGDDRAVTCAPLVAGLPHGEVTTTVGGIAYSYDARCFFQAHRGLLGALIRTTVGSWRGEVAYDLYSGVGFFSLPLAKAYERVVAVEGDPIAARFARKNARRGRLRNVEIVGQAVETWIRQLPDRVDRVLVDPARAGLPRRVRRALLDRQPKRLTYASCHPAALARDLKALAAGFRVEALTLLDLFPQTGHMEVVVQLVGEGGSEAMRQ